MAISPARIVAFDVLLRVESEDAYASDLLHAALDTSAPGPHSMQSRAAPIKPADAALATELTLGVLRQRRLLDFLLERQMRKPASRLDLAVALALRIGLYQVRFLGRIPAHAAVSESVELVRRARKSSAASLVNAVLRRCAENSARDVAGDLPQSLPPADRLGILHSHPSWLVERWLVRFGESRTVAMLEADNDAPRLTCAVHEIARRDEVIRELEHCGLRVEPGALLKSAFAVNGGSVTATDAFRRGAISIQDEASQIIPRLLDVRPGHHVLDLCAAPGGKTAILARAASETGFVAAADIHGHRLRATRAHLDRLGLSQVRLIQLDAKRPLPFATRFDRILVDAPCSGTGTLARHPEIRWRLRPGQLDDLQRLQIAIFRSALNALAPGGRLVYSTCSLESEENESLVTQALAAPSAAQICRLTTNDVAPLLTSQLVRGLDPFSFFDSGSDFRTLPGTHPADGFFAAIFEKR